MPAVREILGESFKHHLWANVNLIEVCERLPDDALDVGATGTYGTIRDTLVHLFAAEDRYLTAMTGRGGPEDPLKEGAFPGMSELKRRALDSGEGLIGLAEAVVSNEIIRVERDGRRYEIPISIFFAQSINHGADHRAHVCTVLTQQSIEPPNLDVWTYLRSGARGR